MYCDRWNLRVNLAKSKMMIFRSGGLAGEDRWIYKNQRYYLGFLAHEVVRCNSFWFGNCRLSSEK